MSYDSIIGNFKNEIDKLDNKRKSPDEQSKLLKTYRSKILKFKKKILKLLFDYNLINEKTSAIFELIITKLSIHIENYCKSSNVTLLKNYFTQFTKILNENIIEDEKLSNSQPFKSKIVQTPPRSPSPKLVTRPRTPELRTPELGRQYQPSSQKSHPLPRFQPNPHPPPPKKSPFNFKPYHHLPPPPSSPPPSSPPPSPPPSRKLQTNKNPFKFTPNSKKKDTPSNIRNTKLNKPNTPFTNTLFKRFGNITGYLSSKLPPFRSPTEEPLSENNLVKGDFTRNQALNKRDLLNLRLLTINHSTCFFDSILVSLFINNNVFYELFFGQNNYTELVEHKNNFYNDQIHVINIIKETIKNVVDNMYKENDTINNVNTIRTQFKNNSSILLNQLYFSKNIRDEFTQFIKYRYAGVDIFLMGLLEIFQIPYNFIILTSNGTDNGNLSTNKIRNLPDDYPFLLIGRQTSNVLQKQVRADSSEIKTIIDRYYNTTPNKNLQSNILKFFKRIDTRYLKDICNNDEILNFKILFSLYKLIDMNSFIKYLYSQDFNTALNFYNNYLDYISVFSNMPYDIFDYNLPRKKPINDLNENIIRTMEQIGEIINNDEFANFDELNNTVEKLDTLFNNPEYTPLDIIRQNGNNYKLKSIIMGPEHHYTALINYIQDNWYFYDDSPRDFKIVANSYEKLVKINANNFKINSVLYIYVLQL